MKIERHENGKIEVTNSAVILSYIALIGALSCMFGVGYSILYKGLNLFSLEIVGLVLAQVILGISSTILYERSNFVFDSDEEELRWSKKKYFYSKKGTIPFYDIQEIKMDRANNNKKEVLIQIVTSNKVINLSDSYTVNKDYKMEELIGDVKSLTGLGIDVSPKNRAKILLELGQTKGALDVIREEMDMSMSDAKNYLGI